MKTIWTCVPAILLSIYVFTSCRTVYTPNAINTPLLQEKGEFKASIANNNIQLATAITDHFGVMVNGYLNVYKSDDKTFRNNGKGAEAGIGYFGHTNMRLTYEAYGGVGVYNVCIREDNAAKTFDADATKFFIQPSLGWVNPFFEVAVTPRFSVIKYATPEIKGYSSQEQPDNHFVVVSQKVHAFLEPTLTLRGGYRFIKLHVQVGHSYKISKNNINNDSGIGSVGLIFDIGKWYQGTH